MMSLRQILPREAQRNGGGGPRSGGGGDATLRRLASNTQPASAPSTTLRAVPLPRFAVEDR